MKVFPVLLLMLWSFVPARAWDKTPSYSEWRDTMENAFKILQSQEDKLLDAEAAKTLVLWPREWRTAAKPDDESLETEKRQNPAAVEVVESCRSALLFGVALMLKVQGKIPPGDSPIGLNGEASYESFAKTYISLAKKCEDGLHMPHTASGLRARFANDMK